jgi:imidazolonepropionase-like amidohydrolase
MITAITNAHIFDGEGIIDDTRVLIEGERICNVGGVVPTGATVIDAHNGTLMPGLIDAHVILILTDYMTLYYLVSLPSWK